MKRKYLVLRFIAGALRVLGALTLIVALIGGIVSLFNGYNRGPGMMNPYWGNQMMGNWGGLGFLISGLFGGIILYGAGEVIDLLIAIEENTRAVVHPHETTEKPPTE